jgi:integrase/recombinase XerD
MTRTNSNSLPSIVQAFFLRFLVGERALSPNTIRSYRDTLKLFLCFAARARACTPDALTFGDMEADLVRAFLRWGETERGYKPRTRNQRLAALKTFFRYVAMNLPEHLERCREIRELPAKRHERPEPEFLEKAEIARLFDAVDPDAPQGLRNQTLLLVLYNTGARVQEVASLDVGDLRHGPMPFVRLCGKGRKVRSCPLWTKTAQALERLISSKATPGPSAPLFLNRQGLRLSRSGIAYIVHTTAVRAGLTKPARARRVTPHVVRHTTAMHLLRAKVDITTIAAWLGHSQLSTTHGYVQVDLRMKEKALEATATPKLREGRYPDPGVIEWLDDLAKAPHYVQRQDGGDP